MSNICKHIWLPGSCASIQEKCKATHFAVFWWCQITKIEKQEKRYKGNTGNSLAEKVDTTDADREKREIY